MPKSIMYSSITFDQIIKKLDCKNLPNDHFALNFNLERIKKFIDFRSKFL